jgi:hypothetical protein
MPTRAPVVKAAVASADDAPMLRRATPSLPCLFALAVASSCGVDHGGLEVATDGGGSMDAPFAAPPRTGTGGGGGGGTSTTPDAKAPATTPVPDAAVAMSLTGVVECGATARCAIETSTCCAGPTGATCQMGGGGNCSTGGRRRCDGPEDCKGQVCCAQAEGGAGLYRTDCSGSCMAGFGMCHTAADCGGQKCCPITLGGVTLNLCRASC